VSKVSLVSLGCPKNLVDSEKLLDKLAEKGISYSADPDDSDILLINTCGFIEDAKRESVEEILRLAEHKDGVKKLVVFGCLAKRFGPELQKEIPEIDVIYGVGDDQKIVEFCSDILKPEEGPADRPEINETAYAYLKIAEGCDRGCSYCVIPDIRGGFISRSPDEVLREAEDLLLSGKKELILVAQDITSYGSDIGGYDLNRLVKDIASISGDFWIRLLYLYPTSITDGLLETMAGEKKVCRYLDIPLQHTESRILSLMKRGGNRVYYEKLIKRIRSSVPDVAIRTTLITGFPQETDEDFANMLAFVQEMKFDRLGVFPYSREEGSNAYLLKDQVPKQTRKRRSNMIMQAQSAISAERNKALVGKTFRALVDMQDADLSVARIYSQAPEIDGVTFIRDRRAVKNKFVNIRITNSYDYDLEGEVI